MHKTDQTLELNNGRTLGFAEYGNPKGTPVFHFGGSGSSRLEHPPNLSILTDLKIRYICPDRPGHGLSSYQPKRELLDWPKDIASLADSLGIDKFYVIGWSAGGPHTLACAHELPDRILKGAIVSGLAPADRPNPYQGYSGGLKAIMFAGRKLPLLAYPMRALSAVFIGKISSDSEDKLIKSLPEVDQKPVSNPKASSMLIANMKEGYVQGGKGPARDDIIINSDWKFDIKDIKTKFDIWQGDLDKNVPLNQGQYQAELMQNADLHVIKGKGHMMILDEWKQILSTLIG